MTKPKGLSCQDVKKNATRRSFALAGALVCGGAAALLAEIYWLPVLEYVSSLSQSGVPQLLAEILNPNQSNIFRRLLLVGGLGTASIAFAMAAGAATGHALVSSVCRAVKRRRTCSDHTPSL